MKIQDLAIIFLIIILPISLVIATYTQYQIKTINTQTLYDSKLTSATYDAIRAFQINTINNQTSDIANSKVRDLEASISSFKNSVKSAFSLDGYSENVIDSYIPALVYTLYDGFYIYSPYNNATDEAGTIKNDSDAKQSQYGLKPYISYSCRYVKGNIDVVITYALDNHISVQGTIDGNYVNKEGYLVDNIVYEEKNGETKISYNGIEIKPEHLVQYLPIYNNENEDYKNYFSYAKINGVTYYLYEEEEQILARLNESTLTVQYKKSTNPEEYYKMKSFIENNNLAQNYYKEAYEFTKWFKGSGLQNLTYGDARDTVIDDDGNIFTDRQLITTNKKNYKIFEFNSSSTTYSKNIENEQSNFNEHRLDIIRHKIEVNLAIAIANYNAYSGAATSNVFQMPKIDEDEWYNITHNISLISFLQGIPIGGKVYNGYSIVTNSESKEVVLERNIYILGTNSDGRKQYFKIGDRTIDNVASGKFVKDTDSASSAGRLNLDFERGKIVSTDAAKTYYFYPLKDNDASYNSVIMQNDADTYDDIYEYVDKQSTDLKKAFYTALGRERGSLNSNLSIIINDGNVILIPNPDDEIEETYYVPIGTAYGNILNDRSKDGYTFKGWYTEKNGKGRKVTANDRCTGNITLYAHWTSNLYTVTFNGNGGSTSQTQKIVQQGKRYGTLPSATRNGYDFDGWYTESGIKVNESDICPGNITLYAHWSQKDTKAPIINIRRIVKYNVRENVTETKTSNNIEEKMYAFKNDNFTIEFEANEELQSLNYIVTVQDSKNYDSYMEHPATSGNALRTKKADIKLSSEETYYIYVKGVDLSGNVGYAKTSISICNEYQKYIIRLYYNALNRFPDSVDGGLIWENKMKDAYKNDKWDFGSVLDIMPSTSDNKTKVQIAMIYSIFTSDEVNAFSEEQFIERLYRAVLFREAGNEGKNDWKGKGKSNILNGVCDSNKAKHIYENSPYAFNP